MSQLSGAERPFSPACKTGARDIRSLRIRLGAVVLSGTTCLVLAMLAGLAFGSTSLQPSAVIRAIFVGDDATTLMILRDLRLPRVLMAANAGAVLAVGGLCFQTVLRNPLAEPYILGISGGAAVGSILGILFGWTTLGSTASVFCGGLAVLALVLRLASGRRNEQSLLLSGVMVNAFCGAVILFLISMAKNDQISSIMFWFMGNLGACTLGQAAAHTLLLLPGYLLLLPSGHSMNLLLLGRDTATTLGLAARRMEYALLILVSLMVSGVVAAVGPLGFVGLVVPQALRLVVGPDNRLLIPASLLFGAAFLVLCDLAARVLPPQGELPAGVVTALIGAPLFILLLRKRS